MAVIALHEVTTGYRRGRGARTVTRDLTATLHEGEFTVLLGPNGAGKSTLMRTLCGLLPPLAGTVRLDGHDLAQLEPRDRARQLGVVLTEQVRVWGLTSAELVALGRQPHTPADRACDGEHQPPDQEQPGSADGDVPQHRRVRGPQHVSL